jgi:GNAT superfamily N-acetyltransferase
MIDVRKGRFDDIDQAIELGRAYYAESAMGSMEFDEAKARALCEAILKTGLGIVAEDNGQLVGMMGAAITTHCFSDTLMAQDYLIYIKPQYRGSGVSKRLITIYIFWAENQGIKRENIFLGVNSGIHSEKTEKIYNSLGFKRFGITMRMKEG